MKFGVSRRNLLQGAAGGLAAQLVDSLSGPQIAEAAEPRFVAVEWGGPYIKAAKEIAAKWDKAKINWVLYTGGAASILPKIKAQWPHPQYDLLASWDPVFDTMIREDWLETITAQDIPNLKNVPEDLIIKDKAGNWKSVPRSISGAFFGYRKDTCPVKIKTIDDLLDPRLKGQLCWPAPLENENLQMIALALHGGGNEHNMEPAWDFMKKLAKSGNIGLVAHAEQEFINAMTTGQVSAGFWNAGPWGTVAKHFPCEFLTKVPDQPGMKFYLFTEGWCVLKGSKHRKLVMDFINFGMSPAMDQLLNDAITEAPTNSKSKPLDDLSYMVFSEKGIKDYTYRPDYNYISKQVDSWQKRFETEIVPLLGV